MTTKRQSTVRVDNVNRFTDKNNKLKGYCYTDGRMRAIERRKYTKDILLVEISDTR